MSREGRAILVAFGSIVVFGLALAYPLASRWEAFGHIVWPLGLPSVILVLVAGAIVIPFVVWKMTLGADARVPQLYMPTIAPLYRGPRGLRTKLRDVPGVLRGAAIGVALLALLRPQNELRPETADEEGIDIVLVLDMSGSMQAIMDTPGAGGGRRAGHRPTRLDVAKDVITDFVTRRTSDRIGVVVFASAAYVLSPPTLDYGLLNTLVRGMQIGQIAAENTAIGDALATAVARLRRSDAKSKVVILLTDGDSNSGSVDPLKAAELAKTHGVRTYTVQIGNGAEAEVEDPPDIFGQPRFHPEKYPVNPELLEKVSKETGGESFIATDRQGLEKSMHDILDHLEKTRLRAGSRTLEELFPFFLVPMIVLVALEALARLFLVRRFP